MENLAKYKLGYIAYIIGGVAYNPADICDNGIRILRGGNIQNKAIVTKSDDVFLPLEYSNGENQIQVGDTILVASTGSVEVLGKAATCFSDLPNTQIGAFIRIVRPKRPEYAMLISIALTSDYFARYIKAQAKGTSINNITIGYLKDFNIMCPHSFEPICSLYSKIEAKIALNREINRNLEAMARQLYDYWFVQFDFPDSDGKPYKSSGGKMVYNPILKRVIPDGWTYTKIKNILDKYPSTKRFETSEYQTNGKYPIIDQGENYIVGFTNEADSILNKYPAILFGDHSTRVKLLCFPFGRGADGTQILYSNHPNISIWHLYLAILTLEIPNPGYSRHFKYLKELPIVIPPLSLAKEFAQKIESIYNDWTNRIFENIVLSRQRDELLPLLMNGQVSVMQ